MPPTAGSLQQQLDRERPLQPRADAPVLRLDPVAAPLPAVAQGMAVRIAALTISGATLFPEATLVAVTGFSAPRELTLTELRAMAARVTAFYRQHGYFVAQAYVPAQQITAGRATIAVVEGRYGQVKLLNRSGVPAALLTDMLAGVRSGDAVAIAPLERSLLMIGDLPGASASSTLVPGASVGSSDLLVEVLPERRLSGSVDADNHGNRYTGPVRAGATLYVSNPSGQGDLLSLRALRSADGLRYGRAAYQAQLGQIRAGAAYSHMRYRLGEDFAALQARGTASIASVSASYPWLRSRHHNLTALANFDAKTLRDEAGAVGTRAEKSARVGMLGLNGSTTEMGNNALSTLSLAWYSGDLALEGASALASDAATLRSDGRFNKLSLQATHQRDLGAGWALSASLRIQFASRNLDTSEKMSLGGADGVRAYPSGEAFGDQGSLLNLELRQALAMPAASLPGQLQWSAFAESGSVRLNKFAWQPGPNSRTLSGAGLGLRWEQPRQFAVNAILARKLGSAAASSAPDSATRFWVDVVKYF